MWKLRNIEEKLIVHENKAYLTKFIEKNLYI